MNLLFKCSDSSVSILPENPFWKKFLTPAMNIWTPSKCPCKGYWHCMLSLTLDSPVCRLFSGSQVWNVVGWGTKPVQGFPEISVRTSLLDWCISLIRKKHFPLCASFSVSICYYNYCLHKILCLPSRHKKLCLQFCFIQWGKRTPKWLRNFLFPAIYESKLGSLDSCHVDFF